MGRIILTIVGPWGKAPALNTELSLDFGPADPDVTQDIADIVRQSGALNARQLGKIRTHEGVLEAEGEVNTPGERGPARAALRLAAETFQQGALAVLVETAGKVFGPKALEELDLDDPRVLFHFLVEVFGEGTRILTEGMQAFGLPDVEVVYGPEDLGPAQAAAFSCAARMVCDGFRPVEGGRLRASESAPEYVAQRVLATPPPEGEEEDPLDNPHGFWRLTRL